MAAGEATDAGGFVGPRDGSGVSPSLAAAGGRYEELRQQLPRVFGLSSGPDAAAKPPGFAEPASALQTLVQSAFRLAFAPQLTLLANITAQRYDA
jgi:hypothetical protein